MKKILVLLICCISVFVLFGCDKQQKAEYNTYTMEIVYNDFEKSLLGTESVLYVNNSDSVLDFVCFHLYPTAFRQGSNQSVVSLNEYKSCYYNGASYGDIRIDNVYIENQTSDFEICGEDENILKVYLKQSLQPQQNVLIEIDFFVKLPNINHRFGYGENTINIANFYPIACVYEDGEFFDKGYNSNGDPFYSQIANYNVKITFPSNLTIAHSGNLKNSSVLQYDFNTEDKTISTECKKIEISAEKVRDFAFVLSEKFQVISDCQDQTQIYYFYYNDTKPDTSLKTAQDALKTFNQMIGKYPYTTLSVVESNFVHGGMEYPNLVYISDGITNYEDYQNVIIHEIAHQWWYNLVGSNAFDNGWQDEGLTDYSTAVFYEKNPEYSRTKDNIILNATRNYSFFVDVYSSVYDNLDTSMTRPLDEYSTSPEYVYIAYVKSMLMFDSLRNLIGDTKFFNGLNIYFENYCFKEAKPEQMIECFEKASNLDLESFFCAWLDGKVIIISP